jgi:hypothetical protein
MYLEAMTSSHACRSDCIHLFAQYNTLMVNFGKALHTVLVVSTVHMHCHVSSIFFLAVISTHDIIFYRVLGSVLFHGLIDSSHFLLALSSVFG